MQIFAIQLSGLTSKLPIENKLKKIMLTIESCNSFQNWVKKKTQQKLISSEFTRNYNSDIKLDITDSVRLGAWTAQQSYQNRCSNEPMA